MNKVVSYWIVGRDTKGQAQAVAYDLCVDGTVLKSGSHSLPAGCNYEHEARIYAARFAQHNGVSVLHYDPDSTDAFADC